MIWVAIKIFFSNAHVVMNITSLFFALASGIADGWRVGEWVTCEENRKGASFFHLSLHDPNASTIRFRLAGGPTVETKAEIQFMEDLQAIYVVGATSDDSRVIYFASGWKRGSSAVGAHFSVFWIQTRVNGRWDTVNGFPLTLTPAESASCNLALELDP